MSTSTKHVHSVVDVGFAFTTEIDPMTQGSPGVNIARPRMTATTGKFVVCALGIFVCYFYYGILQEKITRSTYGENEKFTCTISLVFLQCVVNVIFAKIMLHTFMPQGDDATRQSYYGSCAFSYLGGMVSSNMALQYINFPTQVLGKSCKPIPVMVLGVLIGKKKYSMAKYFFVLLIVVGVCLFMYKDRRANPSAEDEDAPLLGIGEILLLISLASDGFTGAIQDRMHHEYKSKSGHMMYYINLWASIFLGVAVFLTGEIFHFIKFVDSYPYVMYNIMLISIASALGQLFIFLTVSDFGPLSCSIITTTRKFFTVLGSVIIFGNVMNNRQWLGTALVFLGLTLDSVYGKKPPAEKKDEKKEKE